MEKFIHLRQTIGGETGGPVEVLPKGGATIRIATIDADHVNVQVTYCSKNDCFSRKLGRAYATEKAGITMHIDELPKKLHRVAQQVVKRNPWYSRSEWPNHPLWTQNFGYMTKYFRPKINTNTDDHGGGSGGAPATIEARPSFPVPAAMM